MRFSLARQPKKTLTDRTIGNNLGGRLPCTIYPSYTNMIEPPKKKALTAAKKALGQLKKVHTMLEEGKYCMDVLQQIRAVKGLLNGIETQVLESHLNTCGKRAFASNDPKQTQKIVEELLIAFKATSK